VPLALSVPMSALSDPLSAPLAPGIVDDGEGIDGRPPALPLLVEDVLELEELLELLELEELLELGELLGVPGIEGIEGIEEAVAGGPPLVGGDGICG